MSMGCCWLVRRRKLPTAAGALSEEALHCHAGGGAKDAVQYLGRQLVGSCPGLSLAAPHHHLQRR